MVRWTCARSRCLNAIAAILLAGWVLAGWMAAAAQTAHVEFKDGVFRLEGVEASADAPQSLLAVYAAGADTPMLGTYSTEGDAIVFRPRFPLAPGVSYRAVFPGGTFLVDPAAKPASTTRVEHIYPSASVLPANELKLYIYFSAPMSRGEAWKHIHLLYDSGIDSGKPVPLAFLELDQELWDPNNQRLTVLFDPGRIKRGLVPTNEIGPPLVEGKHYKLVIDRDWDDARGVPLADSFEKTFTGAPADRTPPDPTRWNIIAPKSGTSAPLIVEFPKPMDYALLQRLLEIPGVTGKVAVDREETRWSFTPDTPWKSGTYHLVADNLLEDIAGNHLDRAFDVDLQKGVPQTPHAKTSSIAFTVQ
jgi:hypothetical protein